MIINLVQKNMQPKPKGPKASLTPASGVTYVEGLTGLDAATVSLFCGAISNNPAINNETGSVYIDYENEHRKFSIGDQVSLPLNGTNYAFDIIGFNHDVLTDAAVYGEATATGKAGITLQMNGLFPTAYKMNNTDTNKNGWKGSVMRTSTMVAMKSYLPDDWEAIIKPVNKDTSIGYTSDEIETVSDNCFLLAEVEVFGFSYGSAGGEGTQYAYYKAGNSTVKTGISGGSGWWERSPTPDDTRYFCYVNIRGDASYVVANRTPIGVAFGFCV